MQMSWLLVQLCITLVWLQRSKRGLTELAWLAVPFKYTQQGPVGLAGEKKSISQVAAVVCMAKIAQVDYQEGFPEKPCLISLGVNDIEIIVRQVRIWALRHQSTGFGECTKPNSSQIGLQESCNTKLKM